MKNKSKLLFSIVFILFAMLMILFIGILNRVPVELKKESFNYEYGETISTEIKDYFEVINEKELVNCKITLDTPKEEIVPVGEYKGALTWRKKTIEFNIIVEDNVFPEIKLKTNKIGIDYGDVVDFDYFVDTVEDKVDGELEYTIEGEYDSEKAGNYEVVISATDKNGNGSHENIMINVGEKPTSKTGHIMSNNSKYPLTYEDETGKITITKEWYGSAWNYIAHLEFSDYDRFGTAVANGKYGSTETTSHAAKRLEAILTVNADYSAPYLNYPVARSGVVYNNKSAVLPAVYSNNSGKLMSAWETGGTPGITGHSLYSLVSSGKVSDTLCFGPPILSNGSVLSGGGGRAQRTTIGTNGKAGDIWLIVSEGRNVDGISSGLTFGECAKLLKLKGCTFGIPLDGGGSSTMVFQGEVLNHLQGGSERKVVDFIYFK